MMTNFISKPQAEALAALVHELRPDWDVSGVMAALGKVRDRGSAWDVAHAALYAAGNPQARTPGVIAHGGEHWMRGKPLGEATSTSGRLARCPEDGHASELAHNCRSCRSERLEASVQAAHQEAREPRVPREFVRDLLVAEAPGVKSRLLEG